MRARMVLIRRHTILVDIFIQCKHSADALVLHLQELIMAGEQEVVHIDHARVVAHLIVG